MWYGGVCSCSAGHGFSPDIQTGWCSRYSESLRGHFLGAHQLIAPPKTDHVKDTPMSDHDDRRIPDFSGSCLSHICVGSLFISFAGYRFSPDTCTDGFVFAILVIFPAGYFWGAHCSKSASEICNTKRNYERSWRTGTFTAVPHTYDVYIAYSVHIIPSGNYYMWVFHFLPFLFAYTCKQVPFWTELSYNLRIPVKYAHPRELWSPHEKKLYSRPLYKTVYSNGRCCHTPLLSHRLASPVSRLSCASIRAGNISEYSRANSTTCKIILAMCIVTHVVCKGILCEIIKMFNTLCLKQIPF